jgi:chaperonin GroES
VRWPSEHAYALQRTERAGVACDAGRPLKGNTMKIRPLHDRVIVKRLDEEKKTASGIVIPDTAAEKPDQGEVMSVGRGKRSDEGELVPLDVKVGDRILFGKYSGQTVTVKGDELLVMREDDILGVVEGRA